MKLRVCLSCSRFKRGRVRVLDSYQTGRLVVAEDLRTSSESWPRFAAEARASGFQSVHALPMRLRGSVIGALNLFHEATGPMLAADLAAAQALADVAHYRDPATPCRYRIVRA